MRRRRKKRRRRRREKANCDITYITKAVGQKHRDFLILTTIESISVERLRYETLSVIPFTMSSDKSS